MIAAEDHHGITRTLARSRRPQAPPGSGRIDGRDLLLMRQQLLCLDRCGVALAAPLSRKDHLRRRDQLQREREAVCSDRKRHHHFPSPWR